MSRVGDWLAVDREALAADRILDAAGALFRDRPVPSIGMADIAEAAGCSRATLYRYFDSRPALLTAFVHREARRIGAGVARRTAGVRDPRARLVDAVVAAIEAVRGDPTVAAWFSAASAGTASDLAASSEVIEALAMAFLAAPGGDGGAEPDADLQDRARWVVRVVLSFLTMPGASPSEERHLIDRFVADAVLDREPPRRSRPASRR